MDSNELESKYVHAVYNDIAQEFNNTRAYLWQGVKNYLHDKHPDELILDAGCGNGKNMLYRTDLRFIGCDTSESLLNICRDKGLDVVNANIKSLPFEDNLFDGVMCIAVLHHIADENDRLSALNELLRVVKVGCTVLFQVWAREQELNKKFKPLNDNNDFMVSWNPNIKDKKIQDRYYHLFSEIDIDTLVSKLKNIRIVSKSYECDNWCFILEKTK
ncbi:putative tRNA methyltransferase 9-like protein [Fadolivirus algeromassiliense]|jgi:ubiquinone/menaquinone biosynthesis C-methylase UbiE|uniref:tRNA methyltransferase 9-like protein n=1 Tax=Fadolivirus FV1/VV64 TaxID=3070911 RepID=A0A7D3QUY1_9VIRU|nr:putative tRNA methyltransferase 9-like protein [Fadolivirus algeromassiliense]QKF94565.1 putative tRNA methyltransferase 9-like protein [Fadolivirus FV1/VV64]